MSMGLTRWRQKPAAMLSFRIGIHSETTERDAAGSVDAGKLAHQVEPAAVGQA